MKSSCLIVGAGGFIGFNLCLEIHNKYDKIYACDSFFPEKIIEKLTRLNIEIIEGGVEGFVLSKNRYKNIKDIFYFAGISVPALVETELERGCFSDQETLVMMLSSIKEMDEKVTFIYGSSGGTVYGKIDETACKESMPCCPISAYGLSKYIQEQYVQFYANKLGFNYRIARISNPYGRILTHGSKNLQGFIDNAVDKTKKNKKIEIWGDGSISRDFIHINDLTPALCVLASNIPSGVYNIGSGHATSLNEVINTIEYLGFGINVSRLKSRNIDVKMNVLDIDKVVSATEWSPKISIEKGLKHLFDVL